MYSNSKFTLLVLFIVTSFLSCVTDLCVTKQSFKWNDCNKMVSFIIKNTGIKACTTAFNFSVTPYSAQGPCGTLTGKSNLSKFGVFDSQYVSISANDLTKAGLLLTENPSKVVVKIDPEHLVAEKNTQNNIETLSPILDDGKSDCCYPQAEPTFKSISFNPTTVDVVNRIGAWQIVDGSTTIFDFGWSNKDAGDVLKMIKFYGINKKCTIGKNDEMMFFETVYGVPDKQYTGSCDISPVNPQTVDIKCRDGELYLYDRSYGGNSKLLSFGKSMIDAELAVEILKKYDFTYKCSIGSTNKISYFRRESNAPYPPSFDPPSGKFTSFMNVRISNLSNDPVYYTTDGTDPSNGIRYTGQVLIKEGITKIRAIARASNSQASREVDAEYNIILPPKVTGEDIAKKYAPLVFLHPSEDYLPMNADAFIKNSSLNWNHDGACLDCDDLVEKEKIDLSSLGKGLYTHQVMRRGWNLQCHHHGRQVSSNENTRPSSGIAGKEGFFLNLKNSCRGGQGITANAYYQVYLGKYVTYWFLYGYNEAPGIGQVAENSCHEGDWEGICIVLNDNNDPVTVKFFGHGGPPKCVAWGNVEKVPNEPSHPIVYSANGSHASYPTVGAFDVDNWPADDYTGKGLTWRTWEHLIYVVTEPWFGYGGGWGEISDELMFIELNGPSGPGYKDPNPL